MEKTIIILNLFKQRNMKIYNIFEPDFDEVLIKQYMLSYNRMDEENINTFKELYSFIISEKENGKKENNISNEKKNEKEKDEIQKQYIFNYYEYYFTFIADSKKLKLNDKIIDILNEKKLNCIENLLLKYYKCIIKLFSFINEINKMENYEEKKKVQKTKFEQIKLNEKKEFEDEIEKIKNNKLEIQNLLIIENLNIEALIQFLQSKFYLFIIENNIKDNPISFTLKLLIFDNCIKNSIINQELKKFLKNILKEYIEKNGKNDGKIYNFLFRMYYLDKMLLEDNSYEIIKRFNLNDDMIFNSKIDKLINYIQIYSKDKNLPNQKLQDKYTELKNKINQLKNENELCNQLKRIEFNFLIENKLISKGFLIVCLKVFNKLVYPFDMSLSLLIFIYNGLICENYNNDEIFKLKNILEKKKFSDYNSFKIDMNSYDFIENDDHSFKKILFQNFLNYLYNNYNIFKIKKLANFPIFHLLLHKIFLWKINFETKEGNFKEALTSFHIFKNMIIKLSCNILNEKIIKIYVLIYEIIGDIYFHQKYYRMAKRIYSSAIRRIHEIKTSNEFKILFYSLRNKVIISKYFSGYEINKNK